MQSECSNCVIEFFPVIDFSRSDSCTYAKKVVRPLIRDLNKEAHFIIYVSWKSKEKQDI